MIIRNSSSMIDYKSRFQTQNVQFKNVINRINTNAKQKKPNFDIVEISLEAKKSQKPENKNTDKLIDYKSSPLNGSRSEAEWAESSLTQQRDGVNSIKNVLEYQKERLDTTLSKIDEYEKIANGDFSQTNVSAMSPKRAAELANQYKENIKTDFSKDIENITSFYNNWANTYDEYSNGLASRVMGNALQDISVKSLGLEDLSSEPDKVKAALNNAIEKLKDISESIENNFYQASGRKMVDASSPDSEMWKNRIALDNASVEMVTVNKDTVVTGQTLKINDTLNYL